MSKKCSISWNNLLICRNFRSWCCMLLQRGISISEREKTLPLRYTGQSRHSSDHEEARGTGRLRPVHSANT